MKDDTPQNFPDGSTIAASPRVFPQVPDHELLRRIGEGACGEVWLARNVFGGFRAVKIVFRRTFEHERPYEREFKGIQRFEPISRTHDSQVDILHVGRNDKAGYFYYVMELADDLHTGQQINPDIYFPKTLKSELAKRGRLPFEDCLRIGLSLTTALGHLHDHGLVHRDVKPSNIVFVHGVTKLADIGLVTDIGDAKSYVGTEGYFSPEGPGRPQADLYSLGKVLYDVSLGRKGQEFPKLPEDWETLPDKENLLELNEVILKACHTDLRRRYQSAGDMHADLLLLQGGKSVKRLRLVERRLAAVTRASIVMTCLAVLAAGFVFQIGHQKRVTSQRLVRSHVDAGTQLMNNGDLFGALLWFAEALQSDAGDIKREENHRIRIASVLRQCPKLVGVFVHDGPVNQAAFSPDGRHIVTASDDKTAAIWDLLSGDRLFSLPHKNKVYQALFSPDGKRLATADRDDLVHVWDAVTGKPLLSGLKHKHIGRGSSGAGQLYFSPDGERLVTFTEFSIAQIWNVSTGEPVGLPLRHDQWISSLAFSSDGRQIVTTTGEKKVWLWDAFTGKLSPVALKHEAPVTDACFDPQGHILATVSDDSCAQLWNLPGGEFLPPPMRHHHWIQSICFSSQGDRLLTVTPDKTAQIWSVATHNSLIVPLMHNYPVYSGVFTLDGRRVVTASGGIYARVWNADTGEPLSPPLKHFGSIRPSNISPDGRLIITVNRDQAFRGDQAVRVWDLANGAVPMLEIRPVTHPHEPFSPDGQLKAVFGQENTVSVKDVISGRALTQPLRHNEPLRQALFSSNGKLLITETIDSTARIWDPTTGEALSLPVKTKYVAGGHAARGHVAGARLPTKKDLQHDVRPTHDLLMLVELMSGNRIDPWGGFVPLEMNEVTNLWAKVKKNDLKNFSTSLEESFAWHDREAKSCESDWNWWAARFHLDQLLASKPSDRTLLARRAYAQMALEQESKFIATNRTNIRAIPPRHPLATPNLVDLSAYCNGSLKDTHNSSVAISQSPTDLPHGLQTLAGISFDVRGIIQLSGRLAEDRPTQIAGIKVGQKCRQLHFLHATRGEARDGTRVGSYIVHYADRKQREFPIVYGRDVRNWWMVSGEPIEADESIVAWMGMSPAAKAEGKFLRIFMSTWETDLGSEEIVSIDFVSSNSQAAPFLIGLTVE